MYILFHLLFGLLGKSVAQDILGCGGFVKSKVPIDFSKVEIKLLTPEGIQKYQTECAPNNGYYMVPFVDKGHFILKVQPPKGWSFEPTYVELHVDGLNDPCSQGKDINFEFLGFTISGKTSSIGENNSGPGGVTLTLQKEETSEVLGKTYSIDGGEFHFSSVQPGKYKVVASHRSYTFKQNEILVTVAQANVQCSTPIIMSGYDVHGKVSAAQLPVKDVHMLLFSDSATKEQVKGCNLSPPSGSGAILKSQAQKFICSVTSNDKGEFTFPSVPPQDYTLVPFHKAEHIEFDLKPQQMKFSVTSGSVTLPQNFAVTGFSVSGLVLNSVGGDPVPDVNVLVNGKQQATTNVKGLYRLQHMNSGMYKITLEKKDVFFPESSVRVGSDTPRLPDIVANGFSLCGHVMVDVRPTKPFRIEQLSVSVDSADGKDKKTKKLNKDSTFCFRVAPGSYVLTPIVPASIVNTGIVISPETQKVTVQNGPVKDIKFDQVLADLKVTVHCIDACGQVAVEMAMDGDGQEKQLKSDNKYKNNSLDLIFEDTLPGEYTLRSIQDKWCWEANQTTTTINRKGETKAVEFHQSGFKLTCSISHDVDMAIYHENTLVDTFPLKKGRNQLCLAKPGKYQLRPKSCHKFELESIVYSTDHQQPVILQATDHWMSVLLESTHSDSGLSIIVKSRMKDKEVTLELSEEKKGAMYVYTGSYLARDGETLEVVPMSEILLIEPASFTGTVKADECAKDFTHFKAFKGLFIDGSVTPALQGVDITVTTFDQARVKKENLKTGKNGQYRVGPLNPRFKHSISATKEGYALIQDEKISANFVARKLAKINFFLALEEDEQPLPGVLITVSGGSYRSNSLTDKEGSLVLKKLEPGQYYYKAMMKEYEFQPSSQVIEVKEGNDLNIAIKGRRVAFSCFGTVTSLNGQPESGITVQATAVGQGIGQAEEALTGEQGEFRIKGLLPNMEYQVQVKQSELFERISPSELSVTARNADVTDVRFIAFRSISQFEVSGNVVTSNEFLRYLKIVMYRASEPDMPVHTASLTSSPFFHLPSLPRDNKEYHIRLESTLDKSRYTYTEPAAGFFATGVYKHITFEFHPQVKALDHDTPQASYLTLPLTVLIILLFYNHTKVLGWIQQLSERSYFNNGAGRKDTAEYGPTVKLGSRKARKEK